MAKEYDLRIEILDSYDKEIEKDRIHHFLKKLHMLAANHDLSLGYSLKEVTQLNSNGTIKK